jgi:type I site-specific restriction endonuclease
MESINFEILRAGWPALASLGGFAEQYSHSDPNSALMKLRSFAEQMVETLYQVHGFQKPYQANLNDLINEVCFRQVTPIAVLDKFHAIRIKGNKAAHGANETTNTALAMVREAYDLGRWFYTTFGGGAVADCPVYQSPPPEDTKTRIKQEKKAILQKLAEAEEQKQQLEDDGEDPTQFDYEEREIDKVIFNKETNRAILRNLMENGIREKTGQVPGKSIIFAHNHKHAVLMKALFDEMFPQYGGRFCQVIDTYDPRAEQLIDDFKNTGGADEITVAISVDMLDTGIDIPELVNLCFAKPIRSQVKFDQMIGRGTRLCPDLFGPGRNKKVFWIFDHWGNFEYFSKKVKEAEPVISKALLQQVFEARITLAEVVRRRFADFVHKHPQLTAKQTRFLSLLQNHIAKYGSIEIDRLYEPPFTTVDSNGLDGVFSAEAEIDELIDILDTFSPPRPGPVLHNT